MAMHKRFTYYYSKQQRDVNLRKSAVFSPLLPEADNTPKLKTDYDITVLTYNVGNENPHKEVARQLKEAISANDNDPDIIVIALQEAKSSRRLKENLAERILKRFIDNTSKQEIYTLLPGNSVLALTCPHPGNWENLSYTHLVIAYKTTSFLPHQIRIINQGQVVTNKRDHKGGLYTLLSVQDTVLGVISVHLDSFNPTEGQKQANALITAARNDQALKGRELSGIIMAGDFNTRFDPNTLAVKPSEAFVINSHKALRPDLTQREAAYVTLSLWQKDYPQLQELRFISPLIATVSEPLLVRNLMRAADRWDYGVLDPIAFADYTEAKNVLITPFKDDYVIAETVRPRAHTAFSIAKQEISDHAAVVARLKVAPPTLKLQMEAKQKLVEFLATKPELQNIHNFLNEAKDPVLFRAYFEYAIAATVPTDDIHRFPYHLTDIVLIKEDIAFIIEHLHALLNQDFDVASYNRLIFGTCEKITLRPGDYQGDFMKETFQQLLNAQTGSGVMLIPLLSPFRKWLDENHLERECYTLKEDGSLRKLGFFHGTPMPQDAKDNLTDQEVVDLRL